MGWTLQYYPRKSLLLARVEGDYGPETAGPLLRALGQAHRENRPRVQLVDRRRAELRFSTMDIYAHPRACRNAGIDPSVKIAVVVAALTPDERFLETVFMNQGYNLKVFDDWRGAVAWAVARVGVP